MNKNKWLIYITILVSLSLLLLSVSIVLSTENGEIRARVRPLSSLLRIVDLPNKYRSNESVLRPPGSVSFYQVVDITIASTELPNTQSFEVNCNSGDMVIGGGYELTHLTSEPFDQSGFDLFSNYPSTMDTWEITYSNNSGYDAILKVYITCLDNS